MSSPAARRTVLITGASGDTGRAAVRESLALELQVRAMVHKKDARSDALKKLGAEVVIGDLLEINTVRPAMGGVNAAYFVWPVQPGLVHATVNFAQAAREVGEDRYKPVEAVGEPRLHEQLAKGHERALDELFTVGSLEMYPRLVE